MTLLPTHQNARRASRDRNAMNLGRRDLLRIGAGVAALAALGDLPALAMAGGPARDAELFAFTAPDDGALVFAVTFPVQDNDRRVPTPAVRLHAGQKSWSITTKSPGFVPGVAEGTRAFIGRSMRTTEAGDRGYYLVVLAVPRSAVPAGRLGTWAEIGDSDTRVRVGNPIVAELLSQDPALARIFHRASPSQDPRLFGEAIARRIAARGGETLSPKAHGERLAAMLLPDVLPFDPAFPVGYTFANQNGRRPSDPIAEVVATVLAGVVTPRPLAKGVFITAPVFPYFETLESPTNQRWPRGFRGSCEASA